VLDSRNAALFNDGHVDKIGLALQNYFDQPVSIAITAGEVQRETPAMRRERLTRERQEQAVVDIERDDILQSLIKRFDGELDRASIMPLDS
jgi:DNA polymerase-3 subunit gamma/tau